jgi:micrococcal nuclease
MSEEEAMYERRRKRFSTVVLSLLLGLVVYGAYLSDHQKSPAPQAVKSASATKQAEQAQQTDTDNSIDTVPPEQQLPAQPASPGTYAISSFVDGDTIGVYVDGKVEKVRFIGVDTPETHKPNTPVQCYGPNAAAYTKSTIGTNAVRLEADPLDTNRDRYGRLLRYVYLPDGTLLNAALIQNGYGFAYTHFPFEKKLEFVGYEANAKAQKIGVWGACAVTGSLSAGEHTNNL